jgi:hypothetical protein
MPSWKSLLLSGLLAASLVPAAAQNNTVPALKATVPHEFKIGNHKFKAGAYELIVVGPGLMLVRDAKGHVLTRLLTRSIPGPGSDMPAHLVFESQKGPYRLASVWLQNSNSGLEILGEDLGIVQSRPVRQHEPVVLQLSTPVPTLMRK